jgi:hypothetical protein
MPFVVVNLPQPTAVITTVEFHVRLVALEPSESSSHHSITLPSGSTDLGRGELTGVHEKALSRQQLTVTVDDETREVILVRKGLNAALYIRGGSGEPKELEKDKMQSLENGDVFTLLSNLYKYRVETEIVTKSTVVPTAASSSTASTSTAAMAPTTFKNPIDALLQTTASTSATASSTTGKALPAWLTSGGGGSSTTATTAAPPTTSSEAMTTTATTTTTTAKATKPKKPKASGAASGGGGTTSLVAKKKKGKKRKAGDDDDDDEDDDGPNECQNSTLLLFLLLLTIFVGVCYNLDDVNDPFIDKEPIKEDGDEDFYDDGFVFAIPFFSPLPFE